MTDSNENDTKLKLHGYARRKWTEQEIREAANYIKKERPEIWQELLENEAAIGDLNGLDATGIAYVLLRKLHQNIDYSEIGDLFVGARKVLREEIRQSYPEQPTDNPNDTTKTPRVWTQEDVNAAIALLKRLRPDVWQDLLEIGETSDDFGGEDATEILYTFLLKSYDGHLYNRVLDMVREEVRHKKDHP